MQKYSKEIKADDYQLAFTVTNNEITAVDLTSGDFDKYNATAEFDGNKITIKGDDGIEIQLDVDTANIAAGTTNVTLDITGIGVWNFRLAPMKDRRSM